MAFRACGGVARSAARSSGAYHAPSRLPPVGLQLLFGSRGAGGLECARSSSRSPLSIRRSHGLRTFCAATSPDRGDGVLEDGDYVTVPRERLNELIESEVAFLASIPVRPVSMREVLDCLDPTRAAKFIQADVPKRFALRIRLIDSLEEWREVEELVEVRQMLCKWYRSLRLVQRGPDVGLKQFTEVIREIRAEGKGTVALAAAGIHKIQARTPGKYSGEFLDRWLDGFLLSRIGSNMLLDQYFACASKEDGGLAKSTGIVNPNTDAFLICKQSSAYVSALCIHYMGSAPICEVENFRADMRGPQPEVPCSFSYIPGFLRYIMIELFKNSYKATVKYAQDAADLKRRPIQVLVACDEKQVAIRVSDRAGGIPSSVGDKIWSYLYGAAASGSESSTSQSSEGATPLSGYGVGLPLSRLHARYLGGNLEVNTYPGYGTDTSLILPKLEKHQVETLPAERLPFQGH